ncbi:MAG TPA: endonuclease domain-containing protein [Thermoanaerobaculia bacterium]
MRSRAKELRRAMTLSERRLWNWLRNRSFGRYKFRRQVPIGPYVLDFYCPALKLSIEVDGRQHEMDWMIDYDGARTTYLKREASKSFASPTRSSPAIRGWSRTSSRPRSPVSRS